MGDDRDLRWTVTMEAALFFSVPSWALMDWGWPSDQPFQFMLAVLTGASMALLLCHVMPAIGMPAILKFSKNWVGRIFIWPIGAWFCLGAAASLGQIAQLSGSMYVLWRNVHRS